MSKRASVLYITFIAAVCLGSLIPSSSIAAQVPDISAFAIRLPVVSSGETSKFHRIVALADGSAEIVAALGYKNDLVGRDVASTLPELENIPIDNPGHNTSVELVQSQKPDLVIIDSSSSPANAFQILRGEGIKVVSINDSYSYSDIALKESAIASILGTPKALRLLTAQLKQVSVTHGGVRVAFLYLRGTAAIYLIGGKGSGADSLLAQCGDIDVGAQLLKNPFTPITAESLIQTKPDVLLLMTKGLESVGGVKGLVTLPGIAQTPAGIHKRVVTVDDSLLLSFGPRTPSMLSQLCTNISRVAHAS